MIYTLPVKMVVNTEKKSVMIEFTEDYQLTIGGSTWYFLCGWKSDGHSVGKYFKHFDAYTAAALVHDQQCEISWKNNNYEIRRIGDEQYRDNMKLLGAPRSVWVRRYLAVSGRSRWLKLTGQLK